MSNGPTKRILNPSHFPSDTSHNSDTLDRQRGTMEVIRASYIWQLENFDELCEKEDGNVIKSPAFSVSATGAFSTKMWSLYLYPKGYSDKCQNYVSLFIKPETGNQLEGEFRLSVLDGKQKRSHEVVVSEAALLTSNKPKWGVNKFLHKNVLQDPTYDLLPKDTLTIFCEVTIKNIDVDGIVPVQRKMHGDFSDLLENGLFSDATLRVEGKEFKVHKNILSARSQTFYRMFRDKPEMYIFSLSELKCKIMRHLLQFVYTEKTDIYSDIAIDLLRAAEHFRLEDLKFNCQEVLAENINIGNVAHLHIIADTFNAKWLKTRTLKFIILNAREVIETAGYKNIVEMHHQLLEEIYRETVMQQCS